jgi:ribosome biogenesis protein Tsr3
MQFAALLPIILQGIEALLAAMPGIVGIVDQAKSLVTSMFTAGKITKAQQDSLHAYIDARAALVAAGINPVWWTVEPDPTP